MASEAAALDGRSLGSKGGCSILLPAVGIMWLSIWGVILCCFWTTEVGTLTIPLTGVGRGGPGGRGPGGRGLGRGLGRTGRQPIHPRPAYQLTREGYHVGHPYIGCIQYQPKLASTIQTQPKLLSKSHWPQWSVTQPQGSAEIHTQPNPGYHTHRPLV